jgi:AraC-like DNA-binding protein
MKKLIILLLFNAIHLILMPLQAQTQAQTSQKTPAEKTDSMRAILPHQSGEAKMQTLKSLVDITNNSPANRHYIDMLLDEARRQKDTEAEAIALEKLTFFYYAAFDNDSIFILGEEAIRFTRQHQIYDRMFSVQVQIIRRYRVQGKTIQALRRAEEAYAEAKLLQLNTPMAYMLSALASICTSLNQYEEAERYRLEGIELAAPFLPNDRLFVFFEYMHLTSLSCQVDRPQDALRYVDSMQIELDRLRADRPELLLRSEYFYTECDRATAYAELKQPADLLASIHRAEALFDPQWAEFNPTFNLQFNDMYASYYRLTGDYDKALALYEDILRFDEKSGTNDQGLLSKKEIADTYSEKGVHTKASELYRELLTAREKKNKEQFYAQFNDFRSLYELDKAELAAAKHLAEIRRQRIINTGLSIGSIALMLIVALTVWNRIKIARKNRGLIRQIGEQDFLTDALERERERNAKLQEQLKTFSTPFTENDEEDEMFGRLTLLMKEKRLFIDSEIKRNDIAARIGISDRKLHDCIKNSTGMNFTEYVNSLRLSASRELLARKGDKLTIDAIALEAGFSSRTTFYRLFHEKYGLSPEEFRKLIK